MREVKPHVVDLLNRNRQSKVNLVLNCVMDKPDMQTGEVITANPVFRSITETIVDATNANEVHNDAVDKMMEYMTRFEMCGSNWRFRSVVRLETVSYTHLTLPTILRV